MSITIYEVHKCASGCGRILPDPGYCARCKEEIDALTRTWFLEGARDTTQVKPAFPDWVYFAGAAIVVLLSLYILNAFLTGVS